MLRKYHVFVVSIFDANTRILLDASLYPVDCRCSERAKIQAIEATKNYVLANRAKRTWCKRYGITASQFEALLADGRIDPLKDYVFEAEYKNGLNPLG